MFTRTLAAALACFALLVVQPPAHADETAGDTRTVWITSGFLSHHTSQRKAPKRGWNETNTGVGIEYALDSHWRLAAGVYDNSVYRRSRYAQVVWSPEATNWRSGDWCVSAGVALGAVDGYPRISHGGFFPTVLPVFALEWKHVGLNLTYIPSLAGQVSGAVALQAKVGFY